MKDFFAYLCLIATATGFAAVLVGWHSFAFWAFAVTIASGVAALKVPEKSPTSILTEIH